MSTGVAAAPSIRGGITATHRKPGRRARGRPVRATARGDEPVAERRVVDGRVLFVLDARKLVERARQQIEESVLRGD